MKYGYYDIGKSIPHINTFTDGSHILVVRNPIDYISTTIRLEDDGWEVRDCIKVLLKDKTLQVSLLRKPFKGTVANNVLTNGCGGLNIDICRLNPGEMISGESNGKAHHGGQFGGEPKGERPIVKPHNKGRWATNVILENTDNIIKQFPVSKGKSSKPKLNSEINRTVINTDMGGGVGIVEGRLNKTNSIANYGDKGSASRYFFNFNSQEELKEYLINLIKC
jgi:hypothetical protein